MHIAILHVFSVSLLHSFSTFPDQYISGCGLKCICQQVNSFLKSLESGKRQIHLEWKVYPKFLHITLTLTYNFKTEHLSGTCLMVFITRGTQTLACTKVTLFFPYYSRHILMVAVGSLPHTLPCNCGADKCIHYSIIISGGKLGFKLLQTACSASCSAAWTRWPSSNRTCN